MDDLRLPMGLSLQESFGDDRAPVGRQYGPAGPPDGRCACLIDSVITRRRYADTGGRRGQERSVRMTGTIESAEQPSSGPVAPATSLSRGVTRGAGWAAGGRLTSQLLQFATGLGLARLLLPEDFGLLASVYVITGLTVLLFDLGLSSALVYQRDLREEDLSTAFWVNAFAGLFFVALLALLGPAVASFFGDARLVYLTPLAGLPFLLGLGVSHHALLTRNLAFKHLALAEVAAAVVNNAVTLTAAAGGLGVFALVAGPAVGSIVMTGVLWWLCPWRPTSFVTLGSVRKLWSFSGGMLTFSLVTYLGRNTDNLLIGRYVGAEALGFYNRAYNLMLLPLHQTGGAVGRVMFPALTSMGDDRARIASTYRRTMKVVTALTVPLLVGLAATAPSLVPFLWGEGWNGAVILLQVLCLAGIPQVFSASESWLYQSQGRTTLMSGMGLISTAVSVLGIVVGLRWGVVGVASGVLITTCVLLPLTMHVACSVIGLSSWRVYSDNAVTVALAAAMGCIVWLLPSVIDESRTSAISLLLQVSSGVLLYSVGILLLRRQLVADLLSVLRTAGRSR